MPHGDEENRPAATKPAEPSSDPGTANTVDREGAGKPKRAGGRKRDPSRSAFRVEAGHLSCIYCSTKLSTNSAAERLRLHITVCQGNVPVELKKEVSEAETAGLERARKRAQSVLVKTDGGEDGKQPDSVRGARQADEKSRRKSTGNAKQQATTAAATDGCGQYGLESLIGTAYTTVHLAAVTVY